MILQGCEGLDLTFNPFPAFHQHLGPFCDISSSKFQILQNLNTFLRLYLDTTNLVSLFFCVRKREAKKQNLGKNCIIQW